MGRRSLLRRVLRTHDGRVGAGILLLLAFVSVVLAPFLGEPNASDFALAAAADGGPPGPSPSHWLGVDPLYRDELARLAAGGRISLLVASVATAVATTIGVAVGVACAVLDRSGARWADSLILRVIDVLLAFPFLLFVMLVGALIGRTDVWTMIAVLGFTGWTGLARIVRERARSVLDRDYVVASRALGGGSLWIGVRHVLPNVSMTALTIAASMIGSMILAEAVLSYLTVGLAPPDASWGRMLHEAETFIVLRPSLVALPAACILASLLAFHRLGEGMRAVMASSFEGTKTEPASSWVRRVPFPLDVAFVAAGLLVLVAMPRGQLAAPASAPAEAPAPVRGGTLHLASTYSARALDPAIASDELSIAVGRMVFGRLVGLDEEGHIVPELVERITWSDQGKTLRLELTRGVRFQDGAPLTSRDVKRSIERALGPKVPSIAASHFSDIVGFDAFHATPQKATELAGLEPDGDHALFVRMTKPNATMPSLLSMPQVAPVCPSTPFDPTKTTEKELCGAGPFTIASFESEEGVELVRYDGYFRPGLPYLDGISIAFRVRPHVQRYRFERGELDLVRELASTDAAMFRSDERYEGLLRLVKNLRVSAIFMNTERPPFDNPALRRAVAHAVDPSVLARLRPDVTPIVNVVPPGVPGRNEDAPGRRHDVAAALEAMREAGFPFDPRTGEGGYPEEIEYIAIPDSFEQVAAEVYQQQLARVGIRVRLKMVSSLSFLSIAQKRGQTQMGWAGWQADYPDPLTFFDPNLVSSSIADVTQNYAFFSNAEVDRLVEEARAETDPQKRRALFAQAEAIVHDLAPWVPTTSPATLEVRQPWLHGYEPSALQSLDMTRAFLANREAAGPKEAALPRGSSFGAALPMLGRRRPR